MGRGREVERGWWGGRERESWRKVEGKGEKEWGRGNRENEQEQEEDEENHLKYKKKTQMNKQKYPTTSTKPVLLFHWQS